MKENYCKNYDGLLICKKNYKNYNDNTTKTNRDLLLKSIKHMTELLKIKESNISSLSKISRITKETTKKGQVDPKKTIKKTFLRTFTYSASRTRTYDIMINSHALLPTELWRIKAKRLPYLTGGNPQLLPAF